jgi:hypothetical protein
MQRRQFLAQSFAGSSVLAAGSAGKSKSPDVTTASEVVIERAQSGKPHAGKVLATIAPHSDDHSILAGGTIAKLIAEGYTGYLIRTSNDEKDSFDLSLGQTVAANEADNQAMAKALGIKQVFDFNYPNHSMDDVSRVEMRARLIFLIRLLKVDTILSYDPWGITKRTPITTSPPNASKPPVGWQAGTWIFPSILRPGSNHTACRKSTITPAARNW